MTKKASVINMVKRNGFISYEAACSMTDWDLNNLHSTFRYSVLKAEGLVQCRLNGVKGYTFANKTLAVKTILKQRKSLSFDNVKEVTGWDAHVAGSVFRKSNLDKMGITKENGVLSA